MTGGQVPVQSQVLALLREHQGGLGEVSHPGLGTMTPPEDEEEAEEDEEDGDGGEEGGQEPGRERRTLGQVGKTGEVGAPEREREVTDGPLVVEGRQETDQPGHTTAALQGVPTNLQPRQPGPGQTVRPQHSQVVVAEVHRDEVQGGGERGGELAQSGVVADVESLQSRESGQTPLLYVQQEGAVGDLQGGQRGRQIQEMSHSQVLQIPLTEADHLQLGERTEVQGRGEIVVRNIQELQHRGRDGSLHITAASPDHPGEAGVVDLGDRWVPISSTVLILNYCLPLDLKVVGVPSVHKDSVLTKDYYSN